MITGTWEGIIYVASLLLIIWFIGPYLMLKFDLMEPKKKEFFPLIRIFDREYPLPEDLDKSYEDRRETTKRCLSLEIISLDFTTKEKAELMEVYHELERQLKDLEARDDDIYIRIPAIVQRCKFFLKQYYMKSEEIELLGRVIRKMEYYKKDVSLKKEELRLALDKLASFLMASE